MKKLASIFREAMTTGQSCDASNSYRECFYIKVIEQAKAGKFPILPSLVCENDGFSSLWERANILKDGNEPEHGRFTSEEGMGPRDAGERLCCVIDPTQGFCDRLLAHGGLWLSWFSDEAHILTDNPPAPNKLESLFGVASDLTDKSTTSQYFSVPFDSATLRKILSRDSFGFLSSGQRS